MQENELKELFKQLFEVDIENSRYRTFELKKKFVKKLSKLKGKESYNTFKKILEILENKDLSNYKNLRYDLKKYKRVHVNTSYVILFYDDLAKKVFFVDYGFSPKFPPKKVE